MLERFLNWTAWTMEVPPAYGPFHMAFAIIGTIVCVAAAWLLRKSSDRVNKILFVGISLFLLITEAYKQVFHYVVVCDYSMPWWIFPFQLCAVPMYLCLLVPFLKPGRLQKGIYNFLAYFNFLGGLMTVVLPHSIITEYVTITVHAFVWHLLLMFIGLYLMFSGRVGTTCKDYWAAVRTFLVLCCIAFGINLLLWDASGGTVNNFFIGPADSSLIIFSDISKQFGWYVSTALYIPTVCLGAYVIFLIFHLVKKYLTHRTKASV